MDDVKELAAVLSTYKQLYLFHVSLIYSLVFVLYVLPFRRNSVLPSRYVS